MIFQHIAGYMSRGDKAGVNPCYGGSMRALVRKMLLWIAGQISFTILFHFAWKALPKALVEGAVISWIDDQIAADIGLSSSRATSFTSWAIPLVSAAMLLLLYHWANTRFFSHDLNGSIRSTAPPATAPPQEFTVSQTLAFERDAWLLDAVWRALSGRWARPVLGQSLSAPDYQRLHDLISGPLRQFLFDGKLPIWAKPRGSSLWQAVPSNFWRAYSINYLTLVDETPEDVRAARDKDGRDTDEWREFMTSRLAVERLWPVQNESPSNRRPQLSDESSSRIGAIDAFIRIVETSKWAKDLEAHPERFHFDVPYPHPTSTPPEERTRRRLMMELDREIHDRLRKGSWVAWGRLSHDMPLKPINADEWDKVKIMFDEESITRFPSNACAWLRDLNAYGNRIRYINVQFDRDAVTRDFPV